MTSLTILVVIVVVMALLFDFVNGWNDSANAIATIVGTRVLSPLVAVMLAAVFNLVGALIGNQVANTMSKMIHVPAAPTPAEQHTVMIIVITGLASAGLWKAVMTLRGMPISGTHSLIGGVVGSGVAASGIKILVAANIAKTLVAMLLAPLLGFLVAFLVYAALISLTVSWRPSTMNRIFGKVQMLSAGCVAVTHGTNDAQKVMGIITMALVAGGFHQADDGAKFTVPLWVQISCAVAISLGTAIGGWKVIKTVGHSLTKLGPPEGCAVETSAAIVLTITAWLGIPTSTTHTVTGSIMGLGATRGMSGVRWGLGEAIILAWVFTLPITAAMGGTLFYLCSFFEP
ncbi:MAG: inorganic phosphate transporter [Planctomycetia bacterium]|nr:inorganic phosphate transporter [Planctomycetia bacterium]